MANEKDPELKTAILRALMAVGGESVLEFCRVLCRGLLHGRAIFIFGNGGSAAIASHIAVDLTQIYQELDDGPVGVIKALASDTATLTGLANDYGYRDVFLRQLQGVAKKGDVVVGISSSGRSPNILAAASAARKGGAVVLGMTGKSGDKFKRLCQHCVVIDSRNKYVIEAVHTCFAHMVVASVRERLLTRNRD